MIVVGKIYEIYGDGYPKINTIISDVPIPNKDTVLRYLRNGSVSAVSPAIPRDVITGSRIPGELYCQNDGNYSWRSDMIYYVEKYNMKLPDDFVRHIMKCADPQ